MEMADVMQSTTPTYGVQRPNMEMSDVMQSTTPKYGVYTGGEQRSPPAQRSVLLVLYPVPNLANILCNIGNIGLTAKNGQTRQEWPAYKSKKLRKQ